jgi:hypothetical protein
MERTGLKRALIAIAALALLPVAAVGQTRDLYIYGPPGWNPYQYPYPDRDGYARFDLNCMDAARLLREDGFKVLDAIRCKRHLPFVYLAIGDDGRKYKVTISQFDGAILEVAPASEPASKRKKSRKKKRKK